MKKEILPCTTIVVFVVFACASDESSSQAPVADDTTQIQEARFIPLGDIDQWITIRGADSRSPVLLVLHGGPGDVQSPLTETYAPYERDFILVHWDQRGSGGTYSRYREETPDLTFDQLVTDGLELAAYLNGRFSGGIVLLGHSWGTAIATEMALRRPDLFSAYVGTGQIASWAESVNWQFGFLKARAAQIGDTELLAELEAIGQPDPRDAAQYFGFARTLRQHFHESDAGWLGGLLELARRTMPEETLEDIIAGMTFSAQALLPFQMEQNLSELAVEFQVPYFVIQGRHDISTPTAPAIAYFEKVAAPEKELVIIAGAGHFALVTHRDEFIEALRTVLGSKH
jgi:proline iminopeptidase